MKGDNKMNLYPPSVTGLAAPAPAASQPKSEESPSRRRENKLLQTLKEYCSSGMEDYVFSSTNIDTKLSTFIAFLKTAIRHKMEVEMITFEVGKFVAKKN